MSVYILVTPGTCQNIYWSHLGHVSIYTGHTWDMSVYILVTPGHVSIYTGHTWDMSVYILVTPGTCQYIYWSHLGHVSIYTGHTWDMSESNYVIQWITRFGFIKF